MDQERPRERLPTELKCPWCLDAADADSVVCPRDRTPIHAECLHEFGICPICHLAVDAEEAPSDESDPNVVLELPRSHWHVPELSREHRGLPRQIRWLYPRRARLGLPAAFIALTAVFVAAESVLWSLIPVLIGALLLLVRRVRPWRPSPEAVLQRAKQPVPNTAAAERLAAGDRRVLVALRSHRQATRDAQRATERVRQILTRRRAIYRTYLANNTPIEEAQQINGIGPGLTRLLRDAGITNLRQLSGRDVRQVNGIGRRRAQALRAWVEEREEAIGRLVEGEQFPGRAEIDARLEESLTRARQEGDEAVTAGERAYTYVVSWSEERESLLFSLNLSMSQPNAAPRKRKITLNKSAIKRKQ